MGVSFTLRGLNTQLSLIRKAGYPIHVAQDICGSYYLNLDMSASLFDNIFWFKSTSPELTGSNGIVADASDVAYYVDSSNWPDISYSHGLITNPDAGVPGAKADIDTYFVDRYLRFVGPAWLAKNITGGYNNSDLFENEDALQRQFVNFNGNFYRYIRFVVTSLVDASFGDPNASSYTTTVSAESKRGFIGFEDFKFYENDTQIQVSDISDITYSSRYQDATYQQESLADSSFSHLLDDSSGTFWISKERKDNGNLLYEASDPSINDISHSNIGVYSRKYSGSAATSYTLQLKDNDNNPQTQTISGEWLQFEFKNNVSFNKIDFRPVGDHKPDIDIDGTSTSFLGTIPRSMAVLTSIDGTNWDVQNEYDNLDISAGVNEFTSNTNYRSLYHPNIKREITKVLDASGGSASNPLTNADTGFNNISRDILKNMLDSDDPATVQRVHTMIKTAEENSFFTAINNNNGVSYPTETITGSHNSPYVHFEILEIDLNNYTTTYDLITMFNRTELPTGNGFHGGWFISNDVANVTGNKHQTNNQNNKDLFGFIAHWWLYQGRDDFYFGSESRRDIANAPLDAESSFFTSFTMKLQILNSSQYRISITNYQASPPEVIVNDRDLPDAMGQSTIKIYYSAYKSEVHGQAHDIRILPNGGKLFKSIDCSIPENTTTIQRTVKNITTPDPWIPIEFKDGDKMEFSLTYGTSNITDASNVALNSSGNRLGSNVVEDQDYYVRIHMK